MADARPESTSAAEEAILSFVAAANARQLRLVVLAVGKRLLRLAEQSGTTQGAANLEEAAAFMDDAAVDIAGSEER